MLGNGVPSPCFFSFPGSWELHVSFRHRGRRQQRDERSDSDGFAEHGSVQRGEEMAIPLLLLGVRFQR